MKRFERRVATLGAALGLLLVVVSAAVSLFQGGVGRLTGYGLLVGLALLVGAVALDPEPLLEVGRSRRAQSGSASVILSALVIGLLLAFNAGVANWGAGWDLTKGHLYTLSGQSVAVAKNLSSDLKATGFYVASESTNRLQMEQLMGLYQQKSGQLKVQYLDPTANPVLATRLGASAHGDLVLQYGNRKPVVLALGSQSEADITAAMQRLESNHPLNICWEVGEGNRDLSDSTGGAGYSKAAATLRSSDFSVSSVVLSQLTRVPANCDVLAIVGSLKPLPAGAVAAVGAYLDAGGKLLLAFDPWVSQDGKALGSANALLAPYGLALSGGLVMEQDPGQMATNDPTTSVALTFGASPIAKALAGQFVFMPQPTAITGTPDPSLTAVPFITAPASAYEIAAPRNDLSRQSHDRSGPFTLMETLENTARNGRHTRIVIVGTSAFAENRAYPPNASGANSELLKGIMQWLSQQDALIASGPPASSNAPLSLTEGQLTFNYLLTLLVMPLLVVLIGAMVWYRRRSRPYA
ncbi:MAG: Gldg family protein [Candidatus Dormibacteraceae bacterium]